MVGIGVFELLGILLSSVMAAGLTVLWVWMIVDCATKEKGTNKIVWILVIVLAHWIGALIYLLARRPKRIQIYGK